MAEIILIAGLGQSNMAARDTTPPFTVRSDDNMYGAKFTDGTLTSVTFSLLEEPTVDTNIDSGNQGCSSLTTIANGVRPLWATEKIVAINTAVGNTALLERSGFRYWLDISDGELYDNAQKKINLTTAALILGGDTIKRVIYVWNQGESDYVVGSISSAYSDGLETLQDRLIADVGYSNISYMCVQQTGRYTSASGVDEQWGGLRKQQEDFCDGLTSIFSAVTVGLPIIDYTHLTVAGQEDAGAQTAESIVNFENGIIDYPKISSIEFDGASTTTVLITITNVPSGVKVTGSGDITGITGYVAGNMVAPTTATLDGDVITAEFPGDVILNTVGYLNTRNPTITNILRHDDSGVERFIAPYFIRRYTDFTRTNCMGGLIPQCFETKTPYATGDAKFWVGPTNPQAYPIPTVLTNMSSPQGFNGTDFVFDGVNDVIYTSEADPLFNSKTKVSVSMWFTPGRIDGTHQWLFSAGIGAGTSLRMLSLQIHSGNYIRTNVLQGAANSSIFSPYILIQDVLHHIVWNIDTVTGLQQLFIDKISRGTATNLTVPLAAVTGEPSVTFGNLDPTGPYPYSGKIHNILFFSDILTPDRIVELYDIGPDLGGNLVLTHDGVLRDKNEKALGTSTFTANEEPVFVNLNEDYVVGKLLGYDSKFDSPLVWDKVIVTYSPPSGTQHKHFTFRARGDNFKSYTSWVALSTTGTWTLKDMVIVNISGDYIKLDSSNFTSNDNITVS